MGAEEERVKAHTDEDDQAYDLAHAVVIYLVALLLTLPLFIILYPFVPEITLPIGEGWRVDHLLTFGALLVAFIVLVRRFQMVVYLILIIGLVALTITSLTGTYGFRDLYRDYAMVLHSLRDTTVNVPMTARQLKPFQNAEELRAAVDFKEPDVRNAAVQMATAYFDDVAQDGDEHTLVQSFSVFKWINSKWRYVSDPADDEYFAKASESMTLLAGDCDDHAVLMAASIKAIGGRVRLVRTTGHIYPELMVGDQKDLERAAYLIRKLLFTVEVGDEPLFHHTDADGQHWINLDYTRNYPGGPLMNERIVGILDL